MLMRISIRKHNQAYLQELASQMGVADITEVLNYLLLDVKGLGYKFGTSQRLHNHKHRKRLLAMHSSQVLLSLLLHLSQITTTL
jgi:hypothetical protein